MNEEGENQVLMCEKKKAQDSKEALREGLMIDK